MTADLTMAGTFNPMNRIFIPTGGIDYSSYLGSPVINYQSMISPKVQSPILGGGNFIGASGNGHMYNPLQIRAEGLTLSRNVKNLYNSVNSGEVDKVVTNFDELKQEYMKTAEYKMLTRGLTDVDDKMINEMVAQKYQNITGVDLANHIDDGVRGNFFAGLWNGMTFGIGQFKSNDDLKEEILGEHKSTGAKVAKTTGSIAGGAALGAGIGCIGGPAGAAIGAGIGAVCGLVFRLWS